MAFQYVSKAFTRNNGSQRSLVPLYNQTRLPDLMVVRSTCMAVNISNQSSSHRVGDSSQAQHTNSRFISSPHSQSHYDLITTKGLVKELGTSEEEIRRLRNTLLKSFYSWGVVDDM